MARKQRTVRRAGEIAGVGLHSGEAAVLAVEPAPPDHGVVFVRTDLPGEPAVPARAKSLQEVERRTALVENGADVNTPEHFLACLTALGIDNLIVKLTGPECPGMDGSARQFLELIEGLEPVDQDAECVELRVERPVSVSVGGASLVAFPSGGDGLSVSYTLDYDHPFLGVQHVSTRVDPETFKADIAGARTFCLESEAEALRERGLGKGADTSNTLVVSDDGVIDNETQWPDEFARHKVLDLLGDLFLVGADLNAHIVAYRSGHGANLRLVQALREDMRRRDGKKPGALNPVQIRRILPHRYPFLLVDRVLEIDGFQRAVGVKNVSVNEPFFQGHYPSEPIMPGVLILEAMAQLAGILLLRKLELTGKVPVLLSVDRVKFRRAVVPGDQIRLEALTLRLSSGRGRVKCRSTVDGALVSEARLNFALTEPPSA